MYKIDLSDYKLTKYYFYLFDIMIKEKSIRKEELLMDNKISPSTYRRCRQLEQNIGFVIVDKLCKVLDIKVTPNEIIDEVEEKMNNIYMNIYYSIYNTLKEDLDYLNNLIKENYTITPILKLIRLLILGYEDIDTSKYILSYVDDYNELKIYKSFYSDNLLMLYDTISVLFKSKVDDNYLLNENKDCIYYYILSSKLCDEKRYIECFYVMNIIEEILIKEKNFKRLLTLYTKKMHILNTLGDYKSCFELAYMQFYALKSFKDAEYEFKYTIAQLVISALGLKKYKIIYDVLTTKDKVNIDDILCLLISIYYINNEKFDESYNYYYENLEGDNRKYLESLYKYLMTKNKNELQVLENTKINMNIIKALTVK